MTTKGRSRVPGGRNRTDNGAQRELEVCWWCEETHERQRTSSNGACKDWAEFARAVDKGYSRLLREGFFGPIAQHEQRLQVARARRRVPPSPPQGGSVSPSHELLLRA